MKAFSHLIGLKSPLKNTFCLRGISFSSFSKGTIARFLITKIMKGQLLNMCLQLYFFNVLISKHNCEILMIFYKSYKKNYSYTMITLNIMINITVSTENFYTKKNFPKSADLTILKPIS